MKRTAAILITSVLFVWMSATGLSADGNEDFGICIHLPHDDEIREIWAADVKWVRTGAPWQNVEPDREPNPDLWRWSRSDRVLDQLRCVDGLYSSCPCSGGDCGAKILYGLGGTPGWANGGHGENYPPTVDHVDDWYNYVYQTLVKYHTQVDAWGIWNEPNLEEFFHGTAQEYRSRILLPAIDAIKDFEAEFGVNIVIAAPDIATNGPCSPAWDFMSQALAGLGSDIDVLTFHSYGDRQSATDMARSFANLVGISEIWMTETGETHPTYDDVDQVYTWMGQTGNRPEKVFYYELTDGLGGTQHGLMIKTYADWDSRWPSLGHGSGYLRVMEECTTGGDSGVVTSNIPRYIRPGARYEPVFLIRNTGDVVWSEGAGYTLDLQGNFGAQTTDHKWYFLVDKLVFPGGNFTVDLRLDPLYNNENNPHYPLTSWDHFFAPDEVGDYVITGVLKTSSGRVLDTFTRTISVRIKNPRIPPPPVVVTN